MAGAAQWQARAQSTFSDAAIQFCVNIKCLFGQPLRQALGMVQSLLQLAKLDWPVPDFSMVCRRQKTLQRLPATREAAFYDAWPIGIATEPHGLPKCPVFLAYALHDPIVPIQHALNLLVAAQQQKLDVEAHVFPHAEHGFALRGLDGTQDQWPALAARWIEDRLG